MMNKDIGSFSPMAGMPTQGVATVNIPTNNQMIEGYANYSANGTYHSRLLGDINSVDMWLLIIFGVMLMYCLNVFKR